jgi:hypothetical protein
MAIGRPTGLHEFRAMRRIGAMLASWGLVFFVGAPWPARAENLAFPLVLPRGHVAMAHEAGHTRVRVRDAGYAQTWDASDLPNRTVHVLLPQEHGVVAWQFIVKKEITIQTEVHLAPAVSPVSRDGRPDARGEGPGGVVSEGHRGRYLSTGYVEGRAVAAFEVFPLRMDGEELLLAEEIELRVETAPMPPPFELAVRERYREDVESRTAAIISHLVINPDMDAGYRFDAVRVEKPRAGFAPTLYPSLEGSPVDYLIVTTEELADEYQELADWKTAKGVRTVVRTVEWITANTRNGSDVQETIRFFVKAAYAKWGIRYLLLGGDTDVIPTRYAFSLFESPDVGARLPTDLYFGCLDGSWNGNHDGNWGEPVLDNPDFYAEVYHGRLPISDPAEVATMIDRIQRYESAETPEYTDKYALLAEVLFPIDWQEGQTIATNGTAFTEPIYGGILDPSSLRITRMYQTENLHPGSVEESRAAVLDSLNAGFNHVFHVGHGFRANISVGDESIRVPDADALVNDGTWCNLYMLNCTAAAYDYSCIGEHFLRNPNGGAVSVIGASELTPPFAAADYMYEYNRLVFGNDVVHIGEAFARSRLPRTPFAVGNDDADAWMHFIYAILADPEMPLFTTTAEAPQVGHVPSVDLGAHALAFTVTAGGSPVDSAVICLTQGDEVYETAVTDASGQATIGVTAKSPGAINVVVTGLNVARGQSSIAVTPVAGPYVKILGVTLDDDAVGGTSGNDDGLVDAGEVVDFGIHLINTGGATAIGVSAVLSSGYPLVSVPPAAVGYGNVGTATPVTGVVRVSFDPGITDETVVDFDLVISDNDSGIWNDGFKLVVHAPRLEFTTLFIDDSMGDGDGVVGTNEPFMLYYALKNYGTGSANGLAAAITDIDNAFVFTDSVDTYPDLAPMAAAQNTSGFDLKEMETTVEHRIRIVVTDTHSRTYADTVEFRPPLPPGPLSFDASLGPDRLWVEWSESPSMGVLRYNVYQSASIGGPYAKVNLDPVDHRMYVSTGLLPLTRYFYVVTTVDASGNESAPSAIGSASTNPPFLPGFPIALPGTTTSSPAVGDIDGDGDNEIVVGNQHVYAWHDDGLELRDGDLDPRTSGVLNTAGDEFTAAIALAHIDDAPGLDIIAADLYTMSVYCMNYSGAVLPGWPRVGTDVFRASPVVGDLDGDGKKEVIAVDAKGVVFAWNRNGSEFIDGDSNPATQGVFYVTPPTLFHYSTPAVCDIDGDAKDEIIVGTRGGIVYALNGDGSSVPGWPFTMTGEMVGGVVAGHISGGYFPEIVVRSKASDVYVLDHDGAVKTGWPRSIPYTGVFFAATPALADFDDDGALEIVLADYSNAPLQARIHVVDAQGVDLPGWPVVYSTTYSECSPLVVDVNGIGGFDVLAGDEDGILHGWDSSGNPLAGFPIATKDAVRATPFVADVDGDGDEDMVVYSWDQHVYVYDFNAPHVAGSGSWPTVHANAHRNGVAGSSVLTAVPRVPIRDPGTRAQLRQNHPNPFNPTTRIVYDVPQGPPTLVSIAIYDVAGSHVRTLVHEARLPGRHVATWDARDDRGGAVASGIYFYRMVAGEFVATRKMLLLR